MPLAGRQLDYGWCLALCKYVGFEYGHGLLRAIAVMNGESARFIGAYHTNDNGTIDRGLFQINSIHDDQLSEADAFKAIPNAECAFELSKHGSDFNPWYAFVNRSVYYEDGLERARWFYENGRGWRRRVALVPEELG